VADVSSVLKDTRNISCRQETKFSAFGENLVPADNFIRHICGQETQVSCGGVKHRRGNLRSRPLYVADMPPHLGPPIIGRRTQRQLAWPRGPCSCGGNIVAARCAAATLIGGSRVGGGFYYIGPGGQYNSSAAANVYSGRTYCPRGNKLGRNTLGSILVRHGGQAAFGVCPPWSEQNLWAWSVSRQCGTLAHKFLFAPANKNSPAGEERRLPCVAALAGGGRHLLVAANCKLGGHNRWRRNYLW
jgi:hypothetical protein